MNENMNLESEKPTFGRSAQIGSILTEKPRSDVPNGPESGIGNESTT
jgi:hypothetical protein